MEDMGGIRRMPWLLQCFWESGVRSRGHGSLILEEVLAVKDHGLIVRDWG